MTLQSMTGFARREGTSGRTRWVWELRSVNGKGLEIRTRLAPGHDLLEPELRRITGARFARGNIQASLSVSADETRMEAVVNRAVLDAVLALKAQLGDAVDVAPLRFDTLVSMRGVIDIREPEEDETARAARDCAILEGLAAAVFDLAGMREGEGAALGLVLHAQIDRIAALVEVIAADPSRNPASIAARLAQQVAILLGAAPALDGDRLYAEAALLAVKADLREETDRLASHIAAARSLLDGGGPVGRKLDFLAQEFNRESNTICSKSTSAAVSAAGIELKVVIDQFREQVQNLE